MLGKGDSMKRICFVDYDMSVTGGVEQVTASLANKLCDEYEVFVYSINDKGELAYTLDDRIHYIKQIKGANRLREMIKGFFKPFIEFVKKENINTVIMMGNYPALVASFCRFFTKAQYIYCDHGAVINQWHQKTITLIRWWDAMCAHRVITLTEKTREDYTRLLHIKADKVECIYNWISPEVLKEREKYRENSNKILSVGRISSEKGFDMLVEVARNVLNKHSDWEWHIYGTGELYSEIEEKIALYGLTGKLILQGNVPEVYKKFKEYSMLVLTSYREGLPLVLLEANATGLPMISFDVFTGPNEVIEDGENGFLIKPYDCKAMEDKINYLIENKEVRIRQSENTYKYINKFSYVKIIDDWRKVL